MDALPGGTSPALKDIADNELRIVIIGKAGTGKTAIAKLIHDELRKLNANAIIEGEDFGGEDLNVEMQQRTESENRRCLRLLSGFIKFGIKTVQMQQKFCIQTVKVLEDGDKTLTAPLKFFDEKTGGEIR